MATLLLERRALAIGNTFLNLQESDSDLDVFFKEDAVLNTPGSCRRRSKSVPAMMSQDSLPSFFMNDPSIAGVHSEDDDIDGYNVCPPPKSPCLWADTDDECEAVMLNANIHGEDAAQNASNDMRSRDAPHLGSAEGQPYEFAPPLHLPVPVTPPPASFPRLLGRLTAQPPESKTQKGDLAKGTKQEMQSRTGAFDEPACKQGIPSKSGLPSQTRLPQPLAREGASNNAGFSNCSQAPLHIEIQPFMGAPPQLVPNVPERHAQVPTKKGLMLSIADSLNAQSPSRDVVEPEVEGEVLAMPTPCSGQENSLEDHELHTTDGTQQEEVTTMMIRNLPCAFTQKELLDEIDSTGFKDLYDFCYMPCCFSTGEGKGFAFINLISVAAAGAFVGKWHKTRRFGIKAGDASLNISPAAIQGFDANVKKWNAPRMKRIRNPNLRPFVVIDQIRRHLEPPAKSCGAPPDVQVSRAESNSAIPKRPLDNVQNHPSSISLNSLQLISGACPPAAPQCSIQNLSNHPDRPIVPQQAVPTSMPPPPQQPPSMLKTVMSSASGGLGVSHAPGTWMVPEVAASARPAGPPLQPVSTNFLSGTAPRVLSTTPPVPQAPMHPPGVWSVSQGAACASPPNAGAPSSSSQTNYQDFQYF